MSWRGPIWASAPLGLRRGARANPVGVVVAIALVVVAHFAPRPPGACNWRCHLLPPLVLPLVQHLSCTHTHNRVMCNRNLNLILTY